VVATWIVKGLRGVQEFETHRMTACLKRRAPAPVISDAFHDGNDVYPDIKDWHDHLNEVMRKSDIVTSAILTLVDDHMLKKFPEDRLSSFDLCHKLDEIIARAEHSLKESKKPGVHNHVKESLLMTELHLVPSDRKTDEAARVFMVPDPSKNGQYLQIYAKSSEAESSSNTAMMGRKGRRTLSVAHRESTLRKSLDRRITLEEPNEQGTENFPMALVPHILDQQPPALEISRGSSSKLRIGHHSSLSQGESGGFQSPFRADIEQPAIGTTSPLPSDPAQTALTIASTDRASSSLSNHKSQNENSRPSTARHGDQRQDQDQYSVRNSSIGSKSISLEQFWAAVVEGGASALVLVQRMLAEDPAVAKICRKSGRTPIMEAAEKFNLPIVEELIEYSNLEQTDSGGQTVLHLLVSALAQRAKSGDDCASFARVLKKLQSKDPEGTKVINKPDDSGSSPLSLCVSSTDEEMVSIMEALIAAGAWITPPQGVPGKNVLKRAVLEGQLLVVKLLIRKGGFVSRDEINIDAISSSQIKHALNQEWKKLEGHGGKKRSGLGGIFKKR
jgi:hypothetical protein